MHMPVRYAFDILCGRSLACSVDDIVATVAITAVQAQ